MQKIILGTLLTFGIANAMYFDNSVDRWESDCNLAVGEGSHCMIAAGMYERGDWENANTGEMVKIEGSKTELMKQAKKLYQKACNQGEKKGCQKAKALTVKS